MVESPLEDKSTKFAVRIVKMVKYLRANRDNTLASLYNQVLRSGTSIMANVGEAQYAQSTADFVAKLHIALKEANETRKWLTVLQQSDSLTDSEATSMLSDLSEIIAMLVSSLNTLKSNLDSDNK